MSIRMKIFPARLLLYIRRCFHFIWDLKEMRILLYKQTSTIESCLKHSIAAKLALWYIHTSQLLFS